MQEFEISSHTFLNASNKSLKTRKMKDVEMVDTTTLQAVFKLKTVHIHLHIFD